jgi:RimJ/RimL family protein N-acetyltransferase
MVWDKHKISFQKLTEADLPIIHKWLNTPEIARWVKWDDKDYPSFKFVQKHWLPRIRGSDPTKCYTVVYNRIKIAFIQTGLLADDPQYQHAFELGFNAAAVDIFIGEEDYIHKGLGSVIIEAFLKDIVFSIYDVEACTIDPEPENKIAIRAYEKAGFRYLKTAWNPIDKVWAYIMVVNRESLH